MAGQQDFQVLLRQMAPVLPPAPYGPGMANLLPGAVALVAAAEGRTGVALSALQGLARDV